MTVLHTILIQLRQAARDERGSVLMETLIVIPLYLVLIGAILWLADLQTTRIRLVEADRYAAWSRGNRHRSGISAAAIKSELAQMVFPMSAGSGNVDFYTGRSLNILIEDTGGGAVESWWHEAYAGVKINMKMPFWMRGFWAPQRTREQAAGNVPAQVQETVTGMVGRNWTSAAPYEGSVVIMRAPYGMTGERTYSGSGLAPAASYSEPWQTRVRDDRWPLP